MNVPTKEIVIGAAGIVAGGTISYIVLRRRFELQLKAHLDAMDKVYEDSLARFTKSGPYATVDEAAAVLIPSEPLFVNTDPEAPNYEADREPEHAADAEPDEDGSEDETRAPKHLLEQYSETQDEEETAELLELTIRQEQKARLNAYASRVAADDEDEEAAAKLAEFVDRYRDRPVSNFGGVTFPGQTDDDDSEEEPQSSVPGFKTVRDPNGPYLISIDEYMDENESPFTKVEMTYFDGDDTLIDSRQQPLPDLDKYIGRKNLERFGEGTTDPDQMYIRNERLEVDIEVTRDENTYTRAILQIIPEDEIARSMLKPQKMRDGDDN